MEVHDQVVELGGLLIYVKCDNGLEIIGHQLKPLATAQRVVLDFIQTR